MCRIVDIVMNKATTTISAGSHGTIRGSIGYPKHLKCNYMTDRRGRHHCRRRQQQLGYISYEKLSSAAAVISLLHILHPSPCCYVSTLFWSKHRIYRWISENSKIPYPRVIWECVRATILYSVCCVFSSLSMRSGFFSFQFLSFAISAVLHHRSVYGTVHMAYPYVYNNTLRKLNSKHGDIDKCHPVIAQQDWLRLECDISENNKTKVPFA